jgi:hypothetical protein
MLLAYVTMWMNKQTKTETETETHYIIGTVKILYVLHTVYVPYFIFMSYSSS